MVNSQFALVFACHYKCFTFWKCHFVQVLVSLSIHFKELHIAYGAASGTMGDMGGEGVYVITYMVLPVSIIEFCTCQFNIKHLRYIFKIVSLNCISKIKCHSFQCRHNKSHVKRIHIQADIRKSFFLEKFVAEWRDLSVISSNRIDVSFTVFLCVSIYINIYII